MQRTLILFKPDALERRLVGQILARFERAGLGVEDCRRVVPNAAFLEVHYADLGRRHPKAFGRTVASLKDKPFVAVILAGLNAIPKVRALTGGTDSLAAAPGTVRGDFGSDSLARADVENRATHNLMHASDSEESAAREIALWFPKS